MEEYAMDDDDALLDDHDVIVSSNENINHGSIASLPEWFIWSYLNVIMGGVILGLIAVGCSFRTNKFKQQHNYKKANKWSHVTLLVNCITTLFGLTTLVFLIVVTLQNISTERKQTVKG